MYGIVPFFTLDAAKNDKVIKNIFVKNKTALTFAPQVILTDRRIP